MDLRRNYTVMLLSFHFCKANTSDKTHRLMYNGKARERI